MSSADSDHLDELDRATANRLARLASLPVDTSRLAAGLRQQIPISESACPRRAWPRALRIAAAVLILLGGIVVALVLAPGGPALASPDALAQVHQEMLTGHSHELRKVNSIEAAAAALSEEWPHRPPLPEMPEMPAEHVMSCCVHQVGRAKMACIALMVNDVPVTLAVADSADVKTPQGATIVRDGVTYQVQSAGQVNMAMTERGGRWICLMGQLPVDQLIEMANKLRL